MGFRTKIQISTSLCCDYCTTISPELPGVAERNEKRLERQGRKAGWALLKENSISNKGVRCWRTWTTHAFCPHCVAKGQYAESSDAPAEEVSSQPGGQSRDPESCRP